MAIPLLHIHNHKDDCMYLFYVVYMICGCHFQGETAEHPWVELNQLAPMIRQMNAGHRKEVITAHNNNWNWKKLIELGMPL